MSAVAIELGTVLDFFNGKAPPNDEDGEFVVYGSNGTIGKAKTANHENAIILGRVGAYCGSVEFCDERFWASDNTIVVKAKDGFDLKYLYYRLKSFPLRSYAGGAAQPLLTQTILRGVRIPIVKDQARQERIAEILSAYDDLIENNRRRIQLLEQAARLLYKEWFVHLRFPGHEHVKIKDGVPVEWECLTLGEIAHTNEESYKAKSLPAEINYIDISSVKQGRILTKTAMRSSEAPGRARRKANDGDVIWSNIRPNLRAYALVLEPEDVDVFSTGFTVLSAKKVPFTWLYLFTTTDSFVGHLVNHATGAGYPAVRPDDFERAEVVVPPKALLSLFHESVEPSFRQISKLEQQNQCLAKARDLLLPRLMNGEVAV